MGGWVELLLLLIFSLFLCVILCLFLSLYSSVATNGYQMKKRGRKSSQKYYVILNIEDNVVQIHTTQLSVAREIGVCRNTLYKAFLKRGIYNNGMYNVWADVDLFLCNKGREIYN